MSTKQKNRFVVCLTALFLFGFCLFSILKPREEESVSERRPLASFPVLSCDSVSSGAFMADFETYALDQFPLRDTFRGVKAWTVLSLLGRKDNNGLYMEEGHLSKLDYPLNTDSITHAADRFRYVYDRYLWGKDTRVYLSVIPDKNYFLAEQNGYPSMDYQALFQQIQRETDFAEYIDIAPLLHISDYYSTDAHWRQEAIQDVAQSIGSHMGISLRAVYEKQRADIPFYGVYSGQWALPLPAEELYYLTNEILDRCTVYDYEAGARIPVYDLSKASGKDPYEMFLAGPKSILTIENQEALTSRELILFRDSFGSSIAPLLAEGYAKITLVDIRYISPVMLDKFITFENQDVLFLYSASVLNNSVTIK